MRERPELERRIWPRERRNVVCKCQDLFNELVRMYGDNKQSRVLHKNQRVQSLELASVREVSQNSI